ncbi:MAG TPA: MDR family MFS transporter [Kineosporiaceae bacterium]|nr:MDR family MFS transporter [Kineosporiaceae bacterium]
MGLRSDRGPVLGGLMLAIALVALDTTIISTAVPSIVTDLGGFSAFPWLFSVYLLTQAVTVPLYGRFADMRGRRPVLFFGIALFLAGSVLCGAAWNMPSLIVFRGLQGLGAGAVQPMTMTIVGDLYTVRERARVQGYVGSVWGASAVIGPGIGGLFSQYLSWRWIFFVNLPIGALAVWMLVRHYREQVGGHRHRIDVAGSLLLVGGCTLVILGLLQGGVSWAWGSPAGIGIFAVAAVLLVRFWFVERRTAEPVLPLWVFRHRVLVGGNLAAAVVGATLIGMNSYVPTFVQGVLGTGALVAGFSLAALSVGWPLASAWSGRVYIRIGFRDTALIGAGIAVAGSVWMALFGRSVTVWQIGAGCFVVGVGLGLSASPTLVAVQSVVDWQRRGVVTGTYMFSRSLGSAVGVAVFGAIVNGSLAARLAHPPAEVVGRLPPGLDATGLVLAGNSRTTPPVVAAFLRSALYDAGHRVFLGLAVVSLTAVLAVALMPRRVTDLAPAPAAELTGPEPAPDAG